MKFQSLVITNYKSIKKSFELKNPGKIHFFIGANNSGKTNILDAIHQLYSKNNQRYIYPDTSIDAVIKINDKELVIKQRKSKKLFTLDGSIISSATGQKLLSKHIIRLRATSPLKIKKIQIDYGILKTKYKNEYRLFTQTLAQYIPQIKITNEFLTKGVIRDNGRLRPFQRLGDGFQQVFTILMYLFNPQYTILLLEEPEIHLHPALIKKLLRILEKRNIGNQIFLTTHSPLFIHTKNLHRLFRVYKDNESTKVYSPRLQGQRLNYERLEQELNADNCEMFFSDKVLLVEGPSDHILMRGLIDKYYRGRKDIKVIQTFGKSNMDIYIDLLKIFYVPYLALLDRDALYDTGIKCINSIVREQYGLPEHELISRLKQSNIFILSNGSIERNYPKRYQRRKKRKTQNALYAISRLSRREYYSSTMKQLREVIELL